MWKTFRFGSLLGIGLMLLQGCSDAPPIAPATGIVTYKAQPVADADVSFIPENGKPAYGRTDAEGRFRLTTFQSEDGALLGQHTVTVVKSVQKGTTSDTNPYAEYQSVLPERYGKPQDSPLKAEVNKGEANDFTFDLTE